MTTPVLTAGPADPNAPLAAKVYTVVSSLLGLVTLAQTFHVLTESQASGINGVAAAGLGLVGAVTTAVAAFRTHKQVNNGTFDPAPAAPVLDAFQSLNAIKQHVDETVASAQSNVTSAVEAIQGAVATLPGGAAINTAVLSGPVGDLIQAVTDRSHLTL